MCCSQSPCICGPSDCVRRLGAPRHSRHPKAPRHQHLGTSAPQASASARATIPGELRRDLAGAAFGREGGPRHLLNCPYGPFSSSDRTDGACSPRRRASSRDLGRGTRPRRGGAAGGDGDSWSPVVRALQLFEEHERNEFRRSEVCAHGDRLEQHRQLQPYLTCPERRRSGDGFRHGRRDELLSGDRRDGLCLAVGVERAGDAPDFLPPPPQRHQAWSTSLYDRPASNFVRRMGGHLGRTRCRYGYRAVEHDGTRDHRIESRQPGIHPQRDDRVRRVLRLSPGLDARTRRSGDWRTSNRHPGDCARVRQGPARDDLLDAGNYRASHGGR